MKIGTSWFVTRVLAREIGDLCDEIGDDPTTAQAVQLTKLAELLGDLVTQLYGVDES